LQTDAVNFLFGVSGEEQAHNLQAGLGTESGEAVGRACDEEGIGLRHISISAEMP
jgi:hypothetical protein